MIKQLRKSLNLDQKSMADLIGISQSRISEIENGKRNLTRTQINFVITLELINNKNLLNELIFKILKKERR